MPRFRDHDWDLRPDGNGFVWRVFGEPGEPPVLRQGWAGTRSRAEDLAQAAILSLGTVESPEPEASPRLGWPFSPRRKPA